MSPFCTELTRLKVLYFIGVGAPIKWSKLVSSLRGTTNMTLYGQRHFITLSIPIWIGHVHILYHPKAYATTSPRSLSQWGNEPATRYATRSILNLPSLGLLPFSDHATFLYWISNLELRLKVSSIEANTWALCIISQCHLSILNFPPLTRVVHRIHNYSSTFITLTHPIQLD